MKIQVLYYLDSDHNFFLSIVKKNVDQSGSLKDRVMQIGRVQGC